MSREGFMHDPAGNGYNPAATRADNLVSCILINLYRRKTLSTERPLLLHCAILSQWNKTHLHSHFAGYLAIRRINIKENRGAQVSDISDFYKRYLRVGNPDDAKPAPSLWHQEFSEKKLWMNQNIAGSYAKSSMRSTPLLHCLRLMTPPLTLVNSHADVALERLAGGVKIPALAVAVAMLRDFGFWKPPTPTSIITAWRAELAFDDPAPDFETLFSLEDLAVDMM